MNLKKISHRIVLYVIIIGVLHFFSQIILNRFASYYFLAYIVAAINGILTVETYFQLAPIKGLLFVRLFWLAYLFRILILIIVLFYHALEIGKPDMGKFFGAFFVYYYTWLTLEIIILVNERQLFRTRKKR